MKHIFRLPAILLPVSIIELYIVVNGFSNGNIGNHSLTITPFEYDLITAYIVIFLSFILHVLLGWKNLLSSKLAWAHVVITILPLAFFCFILLTRFNQPVPEVPHFQFGYWNTFNPFIFKLFALSPSITALVQLSFWIYCIIVLKKPGYFKPV